MEIHPIKIIMTMMMNHPVKLMKPPVPQKKQEPIIPLGQSMMLMMIQLENIPLGVATSDSTNTSTTGRPIPKAEDTHATSMETNCSGSLTKAPNVQGKSIRLRGRHSVPKKRLS